MNSTMLVSNSILNKAFSVDKYITPRQLNDMLLTASDKYFLATGESFLLEKPMIGYDGQSWYYSVIDRYYFYGLDVCIDEYWADGRGRFIMIDGDVNIESQVAINRAWYEIVVAASSF